MSGYGGVNGANGLNGRGGGFCFFLGFGLGGLVVEGGGSVIGDFCFLAVGDGDEFGGIAVIVGLDGNCGGFSDGVVEGEGDGLYHGVVDGFIVGLMCHGLAASATHCRQGKHRYEGSR